jgi:mannonate dehydratase
MRERLSALLDAMPAGYKTMIFAFDYAHNERGERVPEYSTFYVPDAYARDVARAKSERFEWVASVHPYRKDSLDALQRAKAEGARAVKWLPAAQGMDPLHPLCKPVFRKLAELNLPLIIHAGKELAVKGPDTQAFGNPLRLRAALDEGVRVVVAHAASLGTDVDLDAGANGPQVDAFALWLRLMDEARYAKTLFTDLSAVAQMNRMDSLPMLMQRTDLHARFLNGSDYPLPGVMPLYSLNKLVEAGLLDSQAVPTLRTLREHNSLLFDFVLKRNLAWEGTRLTKSVFETRAFFA